MRTRASRARVAPSIPEPAPVAGDAPFVAIVGDRLDCMRTLRERPDAEPFTASADVWGSHRGAVVGIDLPSCGDRRERVRALAEECDELCRRLRRLEHIILLVRGGDAAPEPLRRELDTAARRIHNRLELECGRSIVVTALLVDGCDDARLLAERVLTRVRQAESLDVGIALRWEEIVPAPIGAVAANDYV